MRDRLVILAAGGGTRLRQAKLGSTKPMTEVGGIPMIVRVLVGARRIGVTRADIVIGYRGDEIKESLTSQWRVGGVNLRFIPNSVWETTANGVSLLFASDDTTPFYLSMADHLFDDAMWDCARNAETPEKGVTLLTDQKIAQCFDIDDATKVQTDGKNITAISKELPSYNALDCGLFAVTEGIFPELLDERAKRGDCSLSDGMRRLGAKGKFWSCDVGDAFWHDVDTPEAFAFAEKYLAKLPPLVLT
jgi:1L-myo-inositol 1-phosphate cytidylyltransferase